MEKRIIELEKKIAFQEHSIAELNDALIAQQKAIKALETQLKAFQEKVASADLVRKQEDETPPPHY